MARRRDVNDEEQALWRAFTRTIKPLKGKRAIPETTKSSESKPRPQAQRAGTLAPPPIPKRIAPTPKTPPLATLDRRSRQRLARGTQSVDDRLDLHGRTQAQAHALLSRFLRRAQSHGAKTVLVITGKGGAAGEELGERGVLRRQVPLWLSLPEFRSLVVGFSTAGIAHGGEGALYVRLRRPRE